MNECLLTGVGEVCAHFWHFKVVNINFLSVKWLILSVLLIHFLIYVRNKSSVKFFLSSIYSSIIIHYLFII